MILFYTDENINLVPTKSDFEKSLLRNVGCYDASKIWLNEKSNPTTIRNKMKGVAAFSANKTD